MIREDLKILVLSFYFPPYNKVGGRRWAKHSKYFSLNSIPTFVITGEYQGTSPWDKDIAELKNNIYRIEHTVNPKPFYQQKLASGFLEKIKWKLSYLTWEIKKKRKKGNYNDLSDNNQLNYFTKAKDLIEKEKITTVILSVGPFHYSSVIPDLKLQFPNVKFVLDYRDYWEDNFAGLSSKQIHEELQLQDKVVSSVDLILSPNSEMQIYYANKFKKPSYCLPHSYDHTDIKVLKTNRKFFENNISLIYGGAFYTGIEENIFLIKQLINCLSEFKQVKAEFHVSIKGYERELSHPAITRTGFIDSDKYFEKVVAADYAILILPPNRVNAMSSKFYELIALRRPILYFGGKGDVSDFLVEKKLGYHITKGTLNETVNQIILNQVNHQVPDPNYDTSAHTFEYSTNLLIDRLVTLTTKTV